MGVSRQTEKRERILAGQGHENIDLLLENVVGGISNVM
jgi:hypothetical protein